MSTPVILHEFKISRDFRHIKWGATLWYNLLRTICAGIVFAILMFFFPQSEGDRAAGLMMPLVMPLAYAILFLPFGMLFSLIGQFFPVANLVSALMALVAVAAGDPIVCIIHKLFPKAVPVAAPPIFSLSLISWVLDAPEYSIAS